MSKDPKREMRGDLRQVVLDSLTHPLHTIDAADSRVRPADTAARSLRHGETIACHALMRMLEYCVDAGDCAGKTNDPPREPQKGKDPTDRRGADVVELRDHAEERRPHLPLLIERAKRQLMRSARWIGAIAQHKRTRADRVRFRLLSDHSRDIILFVRMDDGRILDANAAAVAAYGYSREELLERTIHDLRAEHTPELTLDQMVQAEAQGILFETVHRRKDGSAFPVEVSSQGATIDGRRTLISVIRDISERKRAQDTLRESEERFRTLSEATFEGVLITQQGRIVDVNQTLVDMTGYARSELIGASAVDLLFSECPEAGEQYTVRGSEEPCEITVRRKDGSTFRAEAKGKASTYMGRPARVGAISDVTTRKRVEETMREGEQRLRAVLDALPVGVFIADADGRITGTNAAAGAIWGGRTPLAQRPEEYNQYKGWWPDTNRQVEAHEWGLARAIAGGETSGPEEIAIQCFDGTRKTIVNYARPIRSNDRIVGAVAIHVDITGRKQAEEELRRSERRFKSTFENAAVGMAHVALDGRFIRFNSRFAEIAGHPADELTNATCPQITRGDDWEAEQTQVQRLRDGQIPHYTIEKRYVRKDGELSWVSLTRSLQRDDAGRPDYYIVLVQDISQRKRLEDELRQLNQSLEEEVITRTEQLTTTVDRLQDEVARRVTAEDRLRRRSQMLEAFFQHTITPLAFLDRQFTFVRVNDAYARADGRDPEFFIAKNYFDLHPSDKNRAIFQQVVESKQPYRAYAKPYTRPDAPQRATTYWNWLVTPLLDQQGEVEFLVFNLENVTEQQQALQEVQERAQQLQQLTLELSQAEDRERRRLAEILHDDLQQMLAAAKFQMGLLGNRVRNDKDVYEMSRAIKDLLSQAIEKSRSLSHELSPPVLGQSDLCETFAWLTEHVQAKHGLDVQFETCETIEVHSEPLKAFLFKAAQEMLFNVIKHAKVKEARLRLQSRRGYICLSISDKGQGFDPQSLDQGGLGLRSIRERVKLLGGRMRVVSAPGKGSVFAIKVPAAPAPAAVETQWPGELSAAKMAAQKKRQEKSGQPSLRILLVDDHKIVREGLEAMLIEERDIQVVGQAGNGREAVELAHQLEPDVIVMDVSMPVMAGDEATRQIKQHQPQTRVIALSMFDDPRTADRMRKAGAAAYLLKTAPSEELLAAIRGSETAALVDNRV